MDAMMKWIGKEWLAFLREEDGLGVIEVVLILVEIFPP